MKAVIDRSGCISCGVCADTCPEVFRIADDNFAEVIAPVTSEVESCALEAKDNCPVNVIQILEDDGREF